MTISPALLSRRPLTNTPFDDGRDAKRWRRMTVWLAGSD
jgi:hypothetical protein